ncbi:hypothetical protein ACN47E_007157 [Coniothyrium glycines]
MLQTSRVPFTARLTAPLRVVAGRIPLPHLLHGYSRVSSTIDDGRHDSASPARHHRAPAVADMSAAWNPDARVFTPNGYGTGRREQVFSASENQAPAPPPQFMPPFPPPGFAPGPWSQNFPPPPPPQQFFHQNQQAFFAAQAEEQARAHHHQQWARHQGPPAHQAPRQGPPPFGMLPFAPPQHHGPPPPQFGGPPPFGFGPPRPPNFQHQQRGYNQMHMQLQMERPYGGSNEDIQASTHPGKKPKFGPSSKGQAKQKETSPGPKDAASTKKGRYGDNKIMLPAPQPTADYLAQAAEPPLAVDSPSNILVILDLNGTVLFRPNKNAKTMIERPFLKPFIRYLFQNFKVMVWSSAKPDNVKSLVSQSLENGLRSQLVAQWARDSFGLSPTNYGQNVQVYKNLKLVWSRDVIQQHHPEYASGGRFGQHNTVLIDDSVLKANAQPSNLLEIPEFSATPEQMEGDALREVAGYLELLRQQADVSKFINKQPFVCDGRWDYEWPDEIAGGGEMTAKVGGKKKNKKNKRQTAAAELARERSATPRVESETKTPAPPQTDGAPAPVAEAIESMSAISLVASVQKDW